MRRFVRSADTGCIAGIEIKELTGSKDRRHAIKRIDGMIHLVAVSGVLDAVSSNP